MASATLAAAMLAVLWSSGAMAATVTMTPSVSNPVLNGTSFYVVLSGATMPEVQGASLSLRFDSTKVTFNGIQLCNPVNCPPPAGSGAATPFDILSAIQSVGANQKDFTFEVHTAPIPPGSFDAVRINFTAANAGEGDAAIQIIDDGANYCWGNPNTFDCYTGFTYNQAAVYVGAPHPPVAVDDDLSTAPNTPASFDVLVNDTFVPGFNPVSLAIKTSPLHGAAIVNGSPGNPSGIRIAYTPAASFAGIDSLAYTVTTPYGSSDATVTINVTNDHAVTDTVTTTINTPIAIAIARNDLGFVDPVQVSTWQFPAHGTVQYSGSPGPQAGVRATYTPNPGYLGTDTFLYSIGDGTLSAIGTVNITITPNAVNDTAYTPLNQPVTILVLANDVGFADPVTVGILSNAANGTLAINGSPGPQSAVSVTYTPNNGFSGTDSFVYSATSSSGTDKATVAVVVNAVAVNDTANAVPGYQVLIDAFANDTGFTDPVTAGIVAGPTKGAVTIIGSPGAKSGVRFRYTANPATSGTDSFVYSITDANVARSATVTITILSDIDQDGVADAQDNCTLIANPDQRDTNGDGYGNMCDPDFNGDGTVNINDYNRLKARLGITPVVDVDTDLDGNGSVNINDKNRLKVFLGKPPGPSGLHPNCPPTCP
jgi:hypothetical protein